MPEPFVHPSHQPSRRRLLRAAGATLALPLLESLAPRTARAAPPPVRLLYFFVPNGIIMKSFTPAAEGANYPLPFTLAPLAKVKGEVSVVTGLDNLPGANQGPTVRPPVGVGGHARGTASFLTSTQVGNETVLMNGASTDQIVAGQVGGMTPVPSLQLGTQKSSGGSCDPGFLCPYVDSISWAGRGKPLGKLIQPQTAFDQLFRGVDARATAALQARRRAYRTSVLDAVKKDIDSLVPALAASDRERLDQFTTGVRALERQIGMTAAGPMCDTGPRPADNLPPYPEQVDQMIKVMVLAFRCDLTRVITFMLNNGISARTYEFLGVSGTHHDLSHGHDTTKIDQWEVGRFASLVEQLGQVTEPDGSTLLRNSLLMFGSELANGNRHDTVGMPILLAGRAGGRLATGKHVRFARGTPVANLHLTVMKAAGATIGKFGDSTGSLAL